MLVSVPTYPEKNFNEPTPVLDTYVTRVAVAEKAVMSLKLSVPTLLCVRETMRKVVMGVYRG
jgi:hypothetical protein